jgi:hypothetical protein
MKYHLASLAAILIPFLIIFAGCVDEQSRFVGTWKNGGATIIFFNDGTVTITGPLGFGLSGSYDFTVEENKITFTSDPFEVTLHYRFQNDNTLVLSTLDTGVSLSLQKQK